MAPFGNETVRDKGNSLTYYHKHTLKLDEQGNAVITTYPAPTHFELCSFASAAVFQLTIYLRYNTVFKK